jgi:hypothetical protein
MTERNAHRKSDTAMTNQRKISWSKLGGLVGSAAWLLPLSACGGESIVGEAKTEATGGAPGSGGESSADGGSSQESSGGSASVEPVDCEPTYEEQRAIYAEWESAPNDLGDLAGKTFRGYVEGGVENVVLAIQSDGAATITFNDSFNPPEPAKDLTMSPGESIFPLEGYVYEIHGATFEDGRLRIALAGMAVYDEWCTLQDSVPHPAEGECIYGLGPDFVGSVECDNVCTYSSGEVYDRYWIDLVLSRPCYCDPDSCFAHVGDDYSSLTIDARLNDAGDRIEGTLSAATDGPLILTLE